MIQRCLCLQTFQTHCSFQHPTAIIVLSSSDEEEESGGTALRRTMSTTSPTPQMSQRANATATGASTAEPNSSTADSESIWSCLESNKNPKHTRFRKRPRQRFAHFVTTLRCSEQTRSWHCLRMRANQRSLKNLKKRNVELQGQHNLLKERLMVLSAKVAEKDPIDANNPSWFDILGWLGGRPWARESSSQRYIFAQRGDENRLNRPLKILNIFYCLWYEK